MIHHRRVENFYLNQRPEQPRDPQKELQTARELAQLTRRQGRHEDARYWEQRAAHLESRSNLSRASRLGRTPSHERIR